MGDLWKTVNWIFSKLWDWSVVAVGAPVIYGFGVNALFGDEYIVASILFFVAVLWVTAKSLVWEEIRGMKRNA